MTTYKNEPAFTIPVIDVPATSRNLKLLREKQGLSVAEIQKVLGMENPQSIYTWENQESKYLPRLDNLVTLAKLYKVSLDELIIIKREATEFMDICEPQITYGLSNETIIFLQKNANSDTMIALQNYYSPSDQNASDIQTCNN